MGRYKLGLLKSFLSYAPNLSGATTLFSHPELPFLKARCREWLQSDGCYKTGVLLPFGFPPQAQKLTFGSPKSLMAVTFLFTNVAGNTSFHDAKHLKE